MAAKRKRDTSRPKAKGVTRKTDRSVQFFMLWGLVILYIVVFSYLSILRYRSYQTGAYDLGTVIQVIWNTSKGWLLQDSLSTGYPMSHFWISHWEFIFILIAVIFKIIPHVYTILILQTVVVALGALPIYWIGKLITHDKSTAVTFSFIYLMYPAIHNANLADVHGITFAAPLLIFTFYYLIKKNFKLFYLFAFLSLICHEHSALLLAMIGLYAIFIMKEKQHGLIVAAVSVIWFLSWFYRLKIRSLLGWPDLAIMASTETHWRHLKQLAHDPLDLFTFWAKQYYIHYFFYIFAPVIFLSFFEWKILLIATPVFLINLISVDYSTNNIEHYYSVMVAPFVFISALFGLQRIYEFFKNKLSHRYKERSIRENVLSIGSTLALVLAIVFFFIKSSALDARHWKVTEHHQVINSVVKLIPSDVSLSAEYGLVPQVARRPEIYVFNDNVGKVDYILYDFYAPSVRLISRSSFQLPSYWPDNDSIRAVISNSNYGVIHYEDGVCLFQKGANYEAGRKELAIDVGSAIETFAKKEIVPPIEFMGYNQFPLLKARSPVENSKAILWAHAIHFTSFWSTQDSLTRDYQVVFKFKSGGQVYYFTHEPVFGVFPTTDWQPNEIVKDEVFWELPENVASGQLEVFATFTDDVMTDFEQLNFVKLFDLNVEIPKEQ